MKRSMSNACNNQKGIDSSDITIAEIFQGKIKRIFQQPDNAGRTPALWSLYHKMVETIIFLLCVERMADFSLHLSCITNRMFDVFAATGHRNYVKAAELYVEMMLSYGESSVKQAAVIKSFRSNDSHVVCYSNHKWIGIWNEACIEQTLMKTSKSYGSLSRQTFYKQQVCSLMLDTNIEPFVID